MFRQLAKLVITTFLTLVSATTLAATLNVNNQTSDCNDIIGAPYCQIQPAIDAALSGDSINIASGSYFSQGLNPAVMVIPTGKSITVIGAGTDNTHLIGDDQGHRGIIVQTGATASISDFSITGVTLSLDDKAHGAGIQNLGALTLSNCLIDGNTTAGNGGGIYSESTLSVTNCIISNNNANRTNTLDENSGGGGIYATGQFELHDSVLYANQAVYAGGGLMLDNLAVTNNATVINSRLLKNHAKLGAGIHSKVDLTLAHSSVLINNANISGGGYGGGLAIETQVVTHIINSLIYFNQADGDGGGIFHGNAAEINIYSSSIVNNSTLHGSGGGIFTNQRSGTVTLSNSLLSGNRDRGVSATNPDAPNCAGTLQSLGYNLVANTRNCYLASQSGDIQNTDAKLKIISNGGNEQQSIVMTLSDNSPAIDQGNPNGCLDQSSKNIALDLVGNKRNQDGNTDGAPRCDIGAFEAPDLLPAVAIPQAKDSPAISGPPTSPDSGGGGSWGYLGFILLVLSITRQRAQP